MSPWKAPESLGGEDVLAPYRMRLMYWLGIVGVVVLLPLGVNDFLRGLSLVGIAVGGVVCILGGNALAIHKGRAPPVPMGLVVVSGILTIGLSVRGQGIYGVLWSYPAVLFFHFCASRRAANVYNGVLCVLVGALVYHYMDAGIAVRFLLTMLVVIVSSNVFLGIISTLQLKLLEQSIVDPLTGAFNRRHMESCLEDAIERHRRSLAPTSLLVLDIDHFKAINDELGHPAGDSVLKGLVGIIRERSRRVDVLFRVGGEEFVLFLPDTIQERALIVAEHLRAAVEGSDLIRGRRVTVSVGVSELRGKESLDSWLGEADAALYRAKRGGRNRVVSRTFAAQGVGIAG